LKIYDILFTSFNTSRISSSETNERIRAANAAAAQFAGEDDQVSNASSSVDASGNNPVDPLGNSVDVSGNSITSKSDIQKINDETTYKKYTYQEIEERIQKNYFEDNQKYSSALDIVATYLKGQKLIYMESKTYCENKLYKLMLPSIFLSAVATVIATDVVTVASVVIVVVIVTVTVLVTCCCCHYYSYY
jgi:hypothetical protein